MKTQTGVKAGGGNDCGRQNNCGGGLGLVVKINVAIGLFL